MEESEEAEKQLTLAKEKVTGFNELKEEIMQTVSEFNEKLTHLVKENLKSEEKQDGLLTCKEADYLSDTLKKKLESTLKLDEKYWELNLQ